MNMTLDTAALTLIIHDLWLQWVNVRMKTASLI